MKRFNKSRPVMGIHSCMEVLKVRPKKIRSIYLQKDWRKNSQLKWVVEQARRYRIDFFEQTKQQLASWGQGHQGVALIVEESPQWSISKSEKSVLIYIDGLEDPRNLGAILRTSWLMGVEGVFLPRRDSIQSLTSVVSKTASGGAEYVPVEFLLRPYHWIEKMKNEGYWIYGLDKKGTNSLWEEKFHKKVVLVAGSEAKGLRSRTQSLCDRLIYIPQKSLVGNYNLSVSIALGLGQVMDQIK